MHINKFSSFLQPEKRIQILFELLQMPEISKYFGHRIDIVEWEQSLKTIPSQNTIPVLPKNSVMEFVEVKYIQLKFLEV